VCSCWLCLSCATLVVLLTPVLLLTMPSPIIVVVHATCSHSCCYSCCLFALPSHSFVATILVLLLLLLFSSLCHCFSSRVAFSHCPCCYSRITFIVLLMLPSHIALFSFLVMPLLFFSRYPYCSCCVVIAAFPSLSLFFLFKYLLAQLLLFFLHCCHYVSLVDMVLPLPLLCASWSLKL
jgi:hypothetical protein